MNLKNHVLFVTHQGRPSRVGPDGYKICLKILVDWHYALRTNGPMAPSLNRKTPVIEGPEKVAFSSFIGSNHEKRKLLEFLTHRFTYFPKETWLKHITVGDVLLNGERAHGEEVLRQGDEVKYLAMTRPEPKIPTQVSVLFEDEDLLIVNKPPHIPVHPGGRYLRNSLINLLKKQRKIDMLFLAHRLDRETSGVCVLTKTHMAKEKMYWQFFNGEVEKTYWALVWGIPSPSSGVIDAPIGGPPPGSSRIRIKQTVNGVDAKSARTKYHTLGTKWIEAPHWTPPPWPALEKALSSKKSKAGAPSGGPPWPISLVEARPITGRTNQIRVHLAHIGAGIVGDKLYDPSEEVFLEMKSATPRDQDDKSPNFMNLSEKLMRRLVIEAHGLHAKRLKIRHPRSGKSMVLEAPPPASWHGLIDRFKAGPTR